VFRPRNILGQPAASCLLQKSVFHYFVGNTNGARYPQGAPVKGECAVRAQFNHGGHQVVEPRLLAEVDQRRDASVTESDHLSDRRALRDRKDGRLSRDERPCGHETGGSGLDRKGRGRFLQVSGDQFCLEPS